MSTEVTKPAASAVAVPSARFAALAEAAKAAAAKERPSITKVSLKAGVISIGGQPAPGNRLEGVVLATTYRNTFYPGRYDPNNIVNPKCWALSVTDEGMAPGDTVLKPEHTACESCPRSEWGSDLNGGRGKACKQSRRLVILPADALKGDDFVDRIKSAELAILDVPVTSVKNWAQYVNILASTVQLPPWAVVTEFSTKPDPKTQFKLELRGLRGADNEAMLDALESRIAEATRIGLLGYEAAEDDEDPDAPPKAEAKPAGKKKF